MQKSAKIYVAGHRGLVGSALVRNLRGAGYNNLVVRTSQQLDLRNQAAVAAFFQDEKPEYVFLAAAKVGGILANNTYGGEFIHDNLMIQANVIHQAHLNNVTKLLFLGSSCIYPRESKQPIREEYLLSGLLEQTNEPYAIAKIAGIKMCQAYRAQYGCNFICAMPTNLYGPNDNYDLDNSHVLPALLRKFHEAKERGDDRVWVWGTGAARREFMHVDDLSDACLFLMDHYNGKDIINIGLGQDISIKDLAEVVKKVVGFDKPVEYDLTKPDGTPRKLLDVSKLHALGWMHSIGLEEGIRSTYKEFIKHYHKQVEAPVV
ncbi:MAG TPA: GDP-L-fucose synthase [Flavisolibacter sp.]|jgi:GDP-L-fucose synthase